MPRSPPPQRFDTAVAERRNSVGVWSVVEGQFAEIERFDLGPAILLVPTEMVLLLTVDLPIQGQRRRAEALPFALEDRIAAPLGAVHCALGIEVAPQRYLAGIVAHGVMQSWIASLAAAGLGHARIVPDALALPIPPAGHWAIDLTGGRALVRCADGAGLALPAAHLAAAWAAAGRPRCIAFAEALPAEMAGETGVADPLATRLAAPALDLRQGVYASARPGMPRLARRIVLVAAAGLVAHGAIAAADTLALDHIAAMRAAETRALLARIAPDAVIGDDVAASAADLLPANGPSRFLPLTIRIGAALKQLGPSVSLRSIAFDAAANTMVLQLETGDMAGLQRVPGAIGAQGLTAEPGAASMNQGKAIGAFLVRSAA